MKNSGFVNSQIKNITGHRNEKSLEAYDSGDEKELQGMSSDISQPFSSMSESGSGNSSISHPCSIASASVTSELRDQDSLKRKSLDKNFSFGLQPFMPTKSKNVYIFNDCNNISVNTAELKNKRRRIMISSDSDDE